MSLWFWALFTSVVPEKTETISFNSPEDTGIRDCTAAKYSGGAHSLQAGNKPLKKTDKALNITGSSAMHPSNDVGIVTVQQVRDTQSKQHQLSARHCVTSHLISAAINHRITRQEIR
ncbi:hypothetical protein [Pseudomonas syringae]|uniref:hypothetical protein n=1 Tax=Pseudomonas syringae TaxID=317 RepID=UPI0012FD3C1C|nr:hypothetical protein [Pseudomonas syringae]